MISENILAEVEFILPKRGTMELPELEYFHQLLKNTISFWNKNKTVKLLHRVSELVKIHMFSVLLKQGLGGDSLLEQIISLPLYMTNWL